MISLVILVLMAVIFGFSARARRIRLEGIKFAEEYNKEAHKKDTDYTKHHDREWDDFHNFSLRWNICAVVNGVAGTVLAGFCVALFIVLGQLAGLTADEQQIALYEDNNNHINTALVEMVESYMSYENKTLTDLKPETATVVIQAYPALQSQPLVQKQIDIYTENQKNILSLKKKLTERHNYKWWLNFNLF